MPFTKVYNGAGSGATAGDYADSRNWELISLRTAAYAWTASGSGTNEYYLRTAASGDPGFIATPPSTSGVYINGSSATKGSLGSLSAGTWGFGDNDTLGYSTVYVRLSGGGDPDAQVADHVQFRQIPQATEHVRIPAGSGNISSNLDQSAVAIGDFIREEGHEGTIGSATGYLRIDPDRFEHSGSGQAWIDIGTAAISVHIHESGSATTGERGLYLRGTAIATLNVMGGDVGLASLPGELSTVTTIRILGDDTSLWVGNGVSLTTLHQYAGEVRLRCAATTVIIYDGEHTSEENGAMTTVTLKAGEYVFKSTGTITTFHLYGGTLDEQQSGAARTISTLNLYAGSSEVLRNKEAVTHTTETTNDSLKLSISP